MRVVLDTNVLIAGFISHGLCSELLEHCGRRHCVIVSDYILQELQERLVSKFKYTTEEAAEAAEVVQSVAETVAPIDLSGRVCRDADDDAILGTAIAGGAACIVTGDTDLLVIHKFQGIRIMRPREFLDFEPAV